MAPPDPPGSPADSSSSSSHPHHGGHPLPSDSVSLRAALSERSPNAEESLNGATIAVRLGVVLLVEIRDKMAAGANKAECEGMRREAERLFRAAIRAVGDMRSSSFRPSPLLAQAKQSLGDLLYSDPECTELSEAERLIRDALKIREEALGATHADTAASLNSLGDVLLERGEDREAERVLRRALAIREEMHPPGRHASVADSLHSLVDVLLATRRAADAEPLMRRALAIRASSAAIAMSETAASLDHLGAILLELSKLPEAESALRRALDLRAQGAAGFALHARGNNAARARDAPDSALSLSLLGDVLHGQKRLAEASRSYGRALAARERDIGPEHPDLAAHLHVLAEVKEEMGLTDEAFGLLSRAHEVTLSTFGPDHPDTIDAEDRLAFLRRHREEQGELAPQGCASCGREDLEWGGDLIPCAACGDPAASYCSKGCQERHWRKGGHKDLCARTTMRGDRDTWGSVPEWGQGE